MLLPRRAVSSRLCRGMCDLSRAEQGSLTSLLGDLQAAEARLSATYPEIFTRAWADHETMLAALDDLTAAADRVRLAHRQAPRRLGLTPPLTPAANPAPPTSVIRDRGAVRSTLKTAVIPTAPGSTRVYPVRESHIHRQRRYSG